MSDELTTAWSAVAERLTALAAEDDQLRSHLRVLARAVLAATDEPAPTIEAEVAGAGKTGGDRNGTAAESAGRAPAPADGDAAPAAPRPLITDYIPLRLGSEITPVQKSGDGSPWSAAEPERSADWSGRQAIADTDLALVEVRCRLKAEGARWAAERERRLGEGADFRTEIEPRDREIIERARGLPDCFLWMCHPSGPSPADLSLFEDVAGCFDALAAAVALVRDLVDEIDDHQHSFEQALDLAAEAQSSLRGAIDVIDGRPDPDQLKVYHWLRATAGKQQVFIQRFMRADDPADPAGWPDLDARIEGLDSQLQRGRERDKRRQSLIKRIRYHLKLIRDGSANDGRHDWQRIIDSVEEMVGDGVPPSSRHIRELLMPMVDDLPEFDELPPGFVLVLREMDRFLAARRSTPAPDAAPEPTAEVARAAELLKGKTIAMIGGVRRPDAQQSLEAALGLREFLWLETREHQSISLFEPDVARPEVALVLLAIRWSSHSFGDVKKFCDQYGKPLVRLPAGYNPNQVAVQILAQCSDQLTET